MVAERAPGELPVDRGPHHVLGDARNPRNGRRNLLALWKRDQARMRVRDRAADLGPADFKEMPSRRGGRGLAVDHQHLHLRERLGMTAQHHSPQPNLIRDRASMPRTPLIEQLLQKRCLNIPRYWGANAAKIAIKKAVTMPEITTNNPRSVHDLFRMRK